MAHALPVLRVDVVEYAFPFLDKSMSDIHFGMEPLNWSSEVGYAWAWH